MSDYEFRNKSFDYAPPERQGSIGGVLLVLLAIAALFLVVSLFAGGAGDPASEAIPPETGVVSTPPASGQ